MAFKKRKAKAKSKPPVEPKLDPVGFDEMPESETVTELEADSVEMGADLSRDKDVAVAVTMDSGGHVAHVEKVPPRPHGAPPPEHCSHEFPGSEGKEFVYVIKPEHRDKYPSKKLVIPVD